MSEDLKKRRVRDVFKDLLELRQRSFDALEDIQQVLSDNDKLVTELEALLTAEDMEKIVGFNDPDNDSDIGFDDGVPF